MGGDLSRQGHVDLAGGQQSNAVPLLCSPCTKVFLHPKANKHVNNYLQMTVDS